MWPATNSIGDLRSCTKPVVSAGTAAPVHTLCGAVSTFVCSNTIERDVFVALNVVHSLSSWSSNKSSCAPSPPDCCNVTWTEVRIGATKWL